MYIIIKHKKAVIHYEGVRKEKKKYHFTSNNATNLLLDIKNNHIEINDGAILLNGTLDYLPIACPHCGIINENQIVSIADEYERTICKSIWKQRHLHLKRRNLQYKELQFIFGGIRKIVQFTI